MAGAEGSVSVNFDVSKLSQMGAVSKGNKGLSGKEM